MLNLFIIIIILLCSYKLLQYLKNKQRQLKLKHYRELKASLKKEKTKKSPPIEWQREIHGQWIPRVLTKEEIKELIKKGEL